jgi:PAS domain S-box-containing protein
MLERALSWWSRRNLAERFATLTAICIAGSALIQGAVLIGVSSIVVRDLEAERIEQRLDRVSTQLDVRVNEFRKIPLILSGTPPLPRIAHLATGGEPLPGETLDVWLTRLGIIFRSMIQANPELLQARLIGVANGGRELVRVERHGDEITIVERQNLKRKGHRPYFKETAKLQPGDVSLSPMDANVENGVVQRPFQPTVRASTPIFTDSGEFFGIIVANAAADRWFQDISLISGVYGKFLAANQDGDYVYRSDGGPIFASYDGHPDRFGRDWPQLQPLFDHAGADTRNFETSDSFVAAHRVEYDAQKPHEFVVLAVEDDPETVFGDTWALTLLGTLVAVILSGLGVIAAYLVARPLRGLMAAARRIAEGRLNAASLVKKDSPEIGELGEALHIMKEAVEERDASLRKSEGHLQAIVDNTIDGLITIDRVGIIQRYNPGCEAIFGYDQEEVIGRNVNMLIPGTEGRNHDAYMRRYERTGEARFIGKRREVSGRHKSGRLVDIEVAIAEIKVGDEVLFSGIVRDITERKRVERLKSEFVSTVTHELRTPLTSIMGSLALLRSGALGKLNEKAMRMLVLAHDNGERLVNLINDILDIDKIEAGALEFNLTDANLRDLITRAAQEINSYAEQYGVRIIVNDIPQDIVVETDPDRFQQVMGNLLSNAAKFSPKGAEVVVSAGMTGHTVRVSVADKGPGIAPEFRKHIFQRFAQADSSDTRAKGGTGLGLSISKAIIDRLGGQIGFDTPPGGGTTFYFELPAAGIVPQFSDEHIIKTDKTISMAGVQPSRGPQHGGSTPPKVLHVEDDPDTSLVLREILIGCASVTSVPTVQRAISALAATDFDLIILDIHLKDGESGYAVMEHLTNRDAPHPTVLIYSVDDVSGDDWPLISRALVKSRTDMIELRRHILELLGIEPFPKPVRRSA